MKFLKTYKVRNDLSDFANNTDENLEALDIAKNVMLNQDDIFKQIGDFTGNYSKKNFSDYAKYLIFQDVFAIIGNMTFSGNNDNSNKIAKSFENNSKDIFKELTEKELLERLDTEKGRLTQLKMTHAISPLDNPLQIKDLRRNIARIATELRQREINK